MSSEHKPGILRRIAYMPPHVAEAAGNRVGGWIVRGDSFGRSSLQHSLHLSYLSRVSAEQSTPAKVDFKYRVVKTAVEMIPGGIGPWGVGDILTLAEGIAGREFPEGRRLDWIDRGVSIVVAIIPVVPATPFREVFRAFRRGVENTNEKAINPQNFS